MENLLVYPAGSTKACQYAADILKKDGIPMIDHPSPEITHLLLDVPSFAPDGSLRGGGRLESLLEMLPTDVKIIGGNLKHNALTQHKTLDLLQDPRYLAINAAITADCALQVASREMEQVFLGCPVLVIGWGRIGKCLGSLLKSIGAEVTIAARQEKDRAMIDALGCRSADPAQLAPILPDFAVVFNTVPKLVLRESDFQNCSKLLRIELASSPGMEGSDVVQAKGLPGVYAPQSSGKLIADTILRQIGRI